MEDIWNVCNAKVNCVLKMLPQKRYCFSFLRTVKTRERGLVWRCFQTKSKISMLWNYTSLINGFARKRLFVYLK